MSEDALTLQRLPNRLLASALVILVLVGESDTL